MQRCKARSKRSGEQCKNFAIKGWGVCRMHGAGGGPKTDKGLTVCKQAPFKHGFYTEEGRDEMKLMRQLMKKEKHNDDSHMDNGCREIIQVSLGNPPSFDIS